MMEGEQVVFSQVLEQTWKSVMRELRISVGHERGNVRFGKIHNNVQTTRSHFYFCMTKARAVFEASMR